MNKKSNIFIKNGGNTVANVMKNVMKFQSNPVHNFQVTSKYKNFNQKHQPQRRPDGQSMKLQSPSLSRVDKKSKILNRLYLLINLESLYNNALFRLPANRTGMD